MFTLTYPWLLVVLALPLLVHWLLPLYRETRMAVWVPFLDRLVRLTGQQPASGAVVLHAAAVQRLFLVVAWVCLVVALARPQWIEDPIIKTRPVRDLMLAVDLSGSMDTTDFTDTSGKQVNRLTAVKQVLDEFLTRRQGDRVGLVFFGSAPFLQAPFTEDIAVVRALLDEAQVRMAGPSTAFGDAIGLAINAFEQSTTKERVLIVLTDGNDTDSQVPPRKAAEIAQDKGITIYCVGAGEPQAAGEDKLDEATLKAVAETTGGAYYWAANRTQLADIYRRIDQLQPHKVESTSYRPKRDLFHWPLGMFVGLGLAYHAVCIAWPADRGRRRAS
jgi:Ca-activated chloride channel family protein